MQTFCCDVLCLVAGSVVFNRLLFGLESCGTHSMFQGDVGEPRRNGEIDSAVEEVKGLMRSVECDLEHKLRARLVRHRPVLSWLPAYVADVISRRRLEETDAHRKRDKRARIGDGLRSTLLS